MKESNRFKLVFSVLCTACMFYAFPQKPVAGQDAKLPTTRLLVRADDMGSSHAANIACIKACRDGIARSAEVIVPGPWFMEAVRLLNENTDIDAGVHLCLTSEWTDCKWRPLTHAPSLVDSNGYFYPMTSQRSDFPPNTGFLDANPDPEEVERELRAQIQTALRMIPQLSHISVHMGAATATPELRDITLNLSKEFGLPLAPESLKHVTGFGGADKSPEQKIADLLDILANLEPGDWLLIEHPGVDTPEMRAIGHKGYENVAADRAGVTAAFTSPKVKQAISNHDIKLVSYADLIGVRDSTSVE